MLLGITSSVIVVSFKKASFEIPVIFLPLYSSSMTTIESEHEPRPSIKYSLDETEEYERFSEGFFFEQTVQIPLL